MNIDIKTQNINELNNHHHHHSKHSNNNNNNNTQIKLKQILDYRLFNNEACNMILVLLVASLEFSIPIKFMEETLEYLNLNQIGSVSKIYLDPYLKSFCFQTCLQTI
jgi:hypothetical protein